MAGLAGVLWASWAAWVMASGVGTGRPLSWLCGAVAGRGAPLLSIVVVLAVPGCRWSVVVVCPLSNVGGMIHCAWCRWRGRFAAVPGGRAWATAGAARRQCVAADRGGVGGSCCCGPWLCSGFFPMCIARSQGARGGVPGADAPGGYVLPIGRQEKRTTPYSKNPAKNKKHKITKTY